jgi:hypothetical protein
VPDDVFLALQTETVTGHLWMSALAADAGPRFRILGDRAGFVKYGMDPQEAALLDGRRPPAADWGVEAAEDVGRIGAADQWHTVESARGDYTDFYSRLAVAIAGEGPVPVDPADAVTGLQIIQAAQRSAAMGTVERLR